MDGEEEFGDAMSKLQELLVAISDSKVLAERKKRELFYRIRSVRNTLEGNRNKPLINTEKGKKRLKDLKRATNDALKTFNKFEAEADYLKELEEAIIELRSSAREVVEVIR